MKKPDYSLKRAGSLSDLTYQCQMRPMVGSCAMDAQFIPIEPSGSSNLHSSLSSNNIKSGLPRNRSTQSFLHPQSAASHSANGTNWDGQSPMSNGGSASSGSNTKVSSLGYVSRNGSPNIRSTRNTNSPLLSNWSSEDDEMDLKHQYNPESHKLKHLNEPMLQTEIYPGDGNLTYHNEKYQLNRHPSIFSKRFCMRAIRRIKAFKITNGVIITLLALVGFLSILNWTILQGTTMLKSHDAVPQSVTPASNENNNPNLKIEDPETPIHLKLKKGSADGYVAIDDQEGELIQTFTDQQLQQQQESENQKIDAEFEPVLNEENHSSYDKYFYLGGPSSLYGATYSDNQDAFFAELSKSEVPLVDKEQYNDICERSWNGISFSKEDKRMVIQAIRRYNFCFLSMHAKKYLKENSFLLGIEEGLERALYPWIQGAYAEGQPQLERFILSDGTVPSTPFKISTDVKSNTLGSHMKFDLDNTNSFLSNKIRDEEIGKKLTLRKIWENLHGRGITMTIANKFTDLVLGLIGQLIDLDCDLPIEIFYRNELNIHELFKIRRLATMYKGVITAINMDTLVPKIWGEIIDGYNNKALALALSQFEEVLFVDADTVFLVNPSEFFEMDEYTNTGMYMFLDRLIDSRVEEDLRDYIKSLFNNVKRADIPPFSKESSRIPYTGDIKFDEFEDFSIPVTDATLANPTIGDRRFNYAESGLFIIRKSTHLPGIMMTMNTLLWAELGHIFHGDKELFWIGQSLVGNENYSMNDRFAVGLGTSYKEERVKEDGEVEYFEKVCSAHPAHIDGDTGRLLWLNGGFYECKHDNNKDGKSEDLKKQLFKFDSVLEVDSDVYDEEKGEKYGWAITPDCRGYVWCAERTSKTEDSKIRTLSKNDIAKYENMGLNWIMWSTFH